MQNFENQANNIPALTPDGFMRSRQGYNYSFLFNYEKKYFDHSYVESKRLWMNQNWTLSIWFSVVYVAMVFAGKYMMKSRQRFELRLPLIAWNLFLAVFSIMGTIRSLPEFVNALTSRGLEYTVCSQDYTHGVSGCWSWLFILSKVPELIDTLFIVLRKQELIFLHWYHHCTVLIYCWYAAHDFTSTGRWFAVMNYTVHSAMYSYYAFRAMRFRIPKWVNIVITSGQISQMIVGIYVNLHAYYAKEAGRPCKVSYENIKVSFLMYFSYFLLFFHFFYMAYISTSSPKAKREQQPDKSKVNGNAANGHVIKADNNNNETILRKRKD